MWEETISCNLKMIRKYWLPIYYHPTGLKSRGGNKRQGAASNWRACHRAKEEVLNLI